jgi:hypothetical protein
VIPILLSFLFHAIPIVQVSAEIRFKEVTKEAGIDHAGATFGASWGDLNADGWPDLWVGNHASMPSLYLNQQDGTFVDVTNQVWSANPKADTHGAAWGDFDNDGDQDLIELVGAQFGRGTGPNQFFINDRGRLVESAKQFSLEQPRARGRTPLWFDANRDGWLDVVLMNVPRPDGQAPSSLFMQTKSRFALANQQTGFRQPQRTRVEKLYDLFVNVRHLRFGLPPILYGHMSFAQIADLSGDGDPDLVLHSPLKIFAVNQMPFEDITYESGFPTMRGLQDVAIEDFDGDQNMDIYLVRSRHPSSLVQTSQREIRGALRNPRGAERPTGVKFRTSGEVSFMIYPSPRIKPEDIVIGQGARPVDRSFSLTPNDSRFLQQRGPDAARGKVFIDYRREDKAWIIHSAEQIVNFVVRSDQPIEVVQAIGFERANGELPDALLMRRGPDLQPQLLTDIAGEPNACVSVVAADFDNDMDLDLYLACTGSVENLPNRLLENDKRGYFTLVANAGGAVGSRSGRADSVVTADYDRDGFMDLFVTNGNGAAPFSDEGPHQLFHNQGNGNHWIEIELEGAVSNRDGIGAMVIIEGGGVKQIRTQGGGMHRYSQNDKRIHFGLAQYTKADRLTVRWPSGKIQTLKNLAADQILLVKEPGVDRTTAK